MRAKILSQKLRSRVEGYIRNTRKVLAEIRFKRPFPSVSEDVICEILDYIKRYVEDADFYLRNDDLETALASISYCEGLLDALRLLKIADFEWPASR